MNLLKKREIFLIVVELKNKLGKLPQTKTMTQRQKIHIFLATMIAMNIVAAYKPYEVFRTCMLITDGVFWLGMYIANFNKYGHEIYK